MVLPTLQIEIPKDDRRPQRIHVIGGFLGTLYTNGAPQQVLFKGRKFDFVYYHPKVVALKIIIGNVFHANLVLGVAGKSHKVFKVPWMALDEERPKIGIRTDSLANWLFGP